MTHIQQKAFFKYVLRQKNRIQKLEESLESCFSVCLKNAFCKMCVTVCGKFVPDEGVVAGYDNRIRDKSPAKWGVQIAGMILGYVLVYKKSAIVGIIYKAAQLCDGILSRSSL